MQTDATGYIRALSNPLACENIAAVYVSAFSSDVILVRRSASSRGGGHQTCHLLLALLLPILLSSIFSYLFFLLSLASFALCLCVSVSLSLCTASVSNVYHQVKEKEECDKAVEAIRKELGPRRARRWSKILANVRSLSERISMGPCSMTLSVSARNLVMLSLAQEHIDRYCSSLLRLFVFPERYVAT